MKKLFLLSVIIFVAITCYGDIKIASLEVDGPDYAANTMTALDAILIADPTIDLIIGPAEGLGGDSNKARIIFGDSSGTITFAPADTFQRSRHVYNTLLGACMLAEEFGVTIIPGTLWEVDEDYRCFESAPIIGPDGRIQRVRRKLQQFLINSLIDPGIRLDTIFCRDGSEYTYLIAISNETRDLPVVYSWAGSDSADIILFPTRRWFGNFDMIHSAISVGCPPDWSYIEVLFPWSDYSSLYLYNWAAIKSVFIDSPLGSTPGAVIAQNMHSSIRPDIGWYILDDYVETPEGLIVAFDPETLAMRYLPHIDIFAFDSLGDPVAGVFVNYGAPGTVPSHGGWTGVNGHFTYVSCEEESLYFLFAKDSCYIFPEDTILFISESSPFCSLAIFVDFDTINAIGESALPTDLSLSAYPNPFNSAVKIRVRGIEGSRVRVEIFDINGKRVRGFKGSRVRGVTPNADNRAPITEFVWQPDKSIGSGIYLVRAKVGDETTIKRIVYLK